MGYEWDPRKAADNLLKHGVDFADAVSVFEDPLAMTVPDDCPGEERQVTIGRDFLHRTVVVVYTWRGETSGSSPPGAPRRASAEPTRGEPMKAEYDFSKGKRGRVAKEPGTKERITIRIDRDVLAWFRSQVHEGGGGSYQTLINRALRSVKEGNSPGLERTLRKVIREEIRGTGQTSRRRVRIRKQA